MFLGGTGDPVGLVHLGAREYDPTVGRFISVDPLQDLTNPQQWHGYAYANNSPATFADPTGTRFYDDDESGKEIPVKNNAQQMNPYHELAVQIRKAEIEAQYATRNRQDKTMDKANVTVDRVANSMPGGSAAGNDGFADIICWDCAPGVIYVWEVKPDSDYGKSQDSIDQLDRYIAGMQALYTKARVMKGPAINPNPHPPSKVPWSKDETITVRSGVGPSDAGIEYYKVDKQERQRTSDGAKPDNLSDAVMMGGIVVGIVAGGLCVMSVICAVGVGVEETVTGGALISRASLRLAA